MKSIYIVISLLFLCLGFFLGSLSIAFVLPNENSEIIYTIIANIVLLIAASIAGFVGLKQINLGYSQIEQNAKNENLNRTVNILSGISEKYISLNSDAIRLLLEKYDMLLPIDTIKFSKLEQFMAEFQKTEEFHKLMILFTLNTQIQQGIYSGFYEEDIANSQLSQFWDDLWLLGWPVIIMQRRRDKLSYQGKYYFMKDLETYLEKNSSLYSSLPKVHTLA